MTSNRMYIILMNRSAAPEFLKKTISVNPTIFDGNINADPSGMQMKIQLNL
jgi:hypothetical protein